MRIPFCKPFVPDTALQYIARGIERGNLAGDCEYTGKCHAWLAEKAEAKKALLTTSGTHALEMAAILSEIQPGDEVIMASFTFSSTANAFALRGAKIVFVDVRPDTMNLDEKLVEEAVTSRTKAIVAMHYGGVCCEMDELKKVSERHNLILIEDAAQAILSAYRGKPAGTLGELGCFSFHQTKNSTAGEGGAIVFKDDRFIDRAEVLREKGTNRSAFFRGAVDKYTWLDVGSSYLPSDMNAAVLWSQLEMGETINRERMRVVDFYCEALVDLKAQGRIETPFVPDHCTPNGHLFFLKVKDLAERTRFISFMNDKDIATPFHYVPLHSSPAGRKYGRFHGEDRFTTLESERLVRLPVNYGMTGEELHRVCDAVHAFFRK